MKLAALVFLFSCSTPPRSPPDARDRCPDRRDAGAGAERVQYCPYIDAYKDTIPIDAPPDAPGDAR